MFVIPLPVSNYSAWSVCACMCVWGGGSIVNAMLVNTSGWWLPDIWIAKVDSSSMILDQQEFEYRVLYDGTTQFVPIILLLTHS